MKLNEQDDGLEGKADNGNRKKKKYRRLFYASGIFTKK